MLEVPLATVLLLRERNRPEPDGFCDSPAKLVNERNLDRGIDECVAFDGEILPDVMHRLNLIHWDIAN